MLDHLVARGHETSCVVLHDPSPYEPGDSTLGQRAGRLETRGIAVRLVESRAGAVRNTAPRTTRARLGRAWRPPDAELYPHLVDAERVQAAVADLGPDCVFVYHFEALAASRAIAAPRVAGVGDPTHLPTLYRIRSELPSPGAVRALLATQGRLRNQPRLMVPLLNACSAVGAFAAHHAQWLRERGAAGMQYFRTPIPDPGVLDDAAETEGPVRLLLLGHLRGIATLDGLHVLARMIPELERRLGPDGFEVRIVGGGPPLPAKLARALDVKSVTFLGHSDDPTDELRRAHALVVPTSIPLGVRVRILTGLAHGSVVVTHTANALGIPELENGSNALLGSTPAALAQGVIRAAREPQLRARLRAGARATYERSFTPTVAAGRIADLLEEAARTAPTRVGSSW